MVFENTGCPPQRGCARRRQRWMRKCAERKSTHPRKKETGESERVHVDRHDGVCGGMLSKDLSCRDMWLKSTVAEGDAAAAAGPPPKLGMGSALGAGDSA